MRYVLRNGRAINAESLEEFLRKYRNTSYTTTKTLEDYMVECSRRAESLGLHLPTESKEAFFQGLLDIGEVSWGEVLN